MDTSEDPKNKIDAAASDRESTVGALMAEGPEHALYATKLACAERAAQVFQQMDQVVEFSADDRLTREEAHEH